MKLSRRLAIMAALLVAAGCTGESKDERIVLGFSQIGAESEWRTANTESIKAAAITGNIDLRFADAQQKLDDDAFGDHVHHGNGEAIHSNAQVLSQMR